METDDQQLIADFLRGESAAVEQVADWLRQAAFRYRRSLTMPWEDVQQELLLEATDLLRRGRFRGESQLKTYLWRVAHCICLNLLRDQGRLRWSALEAHTERLPAPGSSSLERVLKKESVNELTQLMEAMLECRKLWRMILDGKNYREMAQTLGVSAGSLRVKVLRCRRKAFERWKNWRR